MPILRRAKPTSFHWSQSQNLFVPNRADCLAVYSEVIHSFLTADRGAMATLEQIYVNLISGCVTASLSLGLFGLAIRFGFNNQIAPRSWSRPQAILKNVLEAPFAFRWISWSIKLSYPDLMAGIPGTGTRSKGFAGPPLKVNLDGIIMLKYHVLLLKISLLATLLCVLVVLPLNMTADCDVSVLGSGTCDLTDGLTDFESTTIANIPPLRYNSSSTKSDDITHVQKFWVENTTSRYLGIALVALIIYWYTCREFASSLLPDKSIFIYLCVFHASNCY